MKKKKLKNLTLVHAGNEYVNILAKRVATKPEIFHDVGFKNIDLRQHFSEGLTTEETGELIYPKGNIWYKTEGMDRDTHEYKQLYQMLCECIFSVIDEMPFDGSTKDQFKQSLESEKIADLVIQAYLKIKNNPNQLKLAFVQILWLYVHDDLRDDQSSPLHTDPTNVEKMNEQLHDFLRSDSRDSDVFKFSIEISNLFKDEPRLKAQLIFLEWLTKEYKKQLDQTFHSSGENTTGSIKKDMIKALLDDISEYFGSNIREAKDANKQPPRNLSEYEEFRIGNSAVASCVDLLNFFSILNSEDPKYAWFQMLKFPNRGDVSKIAALHIGATNCVFSAVREFNNWDLTNFVVMKKETDGLPWPDAYQASTDYVNEKYLELISISKKIKEDLHKKTKDALHSNKTLQDIEPSELNDEYQEHYMDLVFKKKVREFFKDAPNPSHELMDQFIEAHPQIKMLGEIINWMDGNICFSQFAPRYK